MGVIPKTNSNEIQLRNSMLIMEQQSQKPRTLHLGCHMTHPSDKRNFTLALGVLEGMIWLIQAENKPHTKTLFHLCYLEKYHMGYHGA